MRYWTLVHNRILLDEAIVLKQTEPEYNLSFTAASLRTELARIIASSYMDVGNWTEVKDRVLKSNALQYRSISSAVRVERELRQRLQRLTHDQIVLLVRGNADDRGAIAWLSALKKIRLAYDFAAEVLREKLASHDRALRLSDYEIFVEGKSLIHRELNELSATSKRKTRQVLLLMLSEAGLLTEGTDLGTIQRPVLSCEVVRSIVLDSPHWLTGFLLPDSEIQEAIIRYK